MSIEEENNKRQQLKEQIEYSLKRGMNIKIGIPDLDTFLGYIRRDISYANANLYKEVAEVYISRFIDLAWRTACYWVNDVKIAVRVDLDVLVALEDEMYSDEARKPLEKNLSEIGIAREDLVSRLELYGMARGTVLCNYGLAQADEMIGRIYEHPYEGCEVQIARIVKAAQSYASNIFRYINLIGWEELFGQEELGLFTRLRAIDKSIKAHQHRCESLKKM